MTQEENFELEKRKVKALEKIANSIDALTIWFEEIDKNEWSDRIQFYLSEWRKTLTEKKDETLTEKKDEILTEKKDEILTEKKKKH